MYKELIHDMHNDSLKSQYDPVHVYLNSFSTLGKTKIVMIRQDIQKFLVITGVDELYEAMEGFENIGFKLCFPNHQNRLILNKFSHTLPL